MRSLKQALTNRVLLTDGRLDPWLTRQPLKVERDFFGAEGILPVLNLTRRHSVGEAHRAYLQAGADVIRCNSHGASPLTLGPLGLGDDAFCINYAAAEIASAAVDSLPGQGRRRFVLGVVDDEGWHAAAQDIEDAAALQSEAMIAGGADAIAFAALPEDTARRQAFLRGAERGKAALAADVPLYVFQEHGHGPGFGSGETGCICFFDGSEESAFLASPILHRRKVNLTGGGDSPAVTARLDALLRQVAEDGLRPFRGPLRPEISEDPEVPSSVGHLEPVQRAWG